MILSIGQKTDFTRTGLTVMIKNSGICILFLAALSIIVGCKNNIAHQTPATIVFMIGTPSSGKTSIAKALQKQLDQPYLYAATDTFVGMLPASYRPSASVELESQRKQGIYFVKDTSGPEVRTYVKLGPVAQKLTTGIIRAIAGFASTGLNIICEGVIWEKAILQEAARGWKDFRVFFVHVNPSLQEAERRESLRDDWFEGGERMQDQVRGAYETIQTFGDIYDLELETTHMTPEQGAERIIEYMQVNPNPMAFKKLA